LALRADATQARGQRADDRWGARAHLEDRRIRGEREGSAVRRCRREEGQPLLGAWQGAGGRGLPAADDDPNVYFYIAMAYAILRHNGVDIGKMDFLGPIKWIDA